MAEEGVREEDGGEEREVVWAGAEGGIKSAGEGDAVEPSAAVGWGLSDTGEGGGGGGRVEARGERWCGCSAKRLEADAFVMGDRYAARWGWALAPCRSPLAAGARDSGTGGPGRRLGEWRRAAHRRRARAASAAGRPNPAGHGAGATQLSRVRCVTDTCSRWLRAAARRQCRAWSGCRCARAGRRAGARDAAANQRTRVGAPVAAAVPGLWLVMLAGDRGRAERSAHRPQCRRASSGPATLLRASAPHSAPHSALFRCRGLALPRALFVEGRPAGGLFTLRAAGTPPLHCAHHRQSAAEGSIMTRKRRTPCIQDAH